VYRLEQNHGLAPSPGRTRKRTATDDGGRVLRRLAPELRQAHDGARPRRGLCGASKETVIVRLLAQRELRLKLARFTDNPEELAISYQRE
jgi:hypothetical protein